MGSRVEEERGGNTNPFDDGEGEGGNKVVMVEEAFKDTVVPPWTKQITFRAIATSFFLSIVFNFIVCKLNLTTGVIPSLNVAAGLLGFGILKFWTTLLGKTGFLKQPFTRQENTVIQTCVVASSGIAFSSGTASYLLGMIPRIAAQSDGGNTPANVKHLSLGWMMAFLFIVSFVGLFSIVPLRKLMILKYKLTYPSGTATAYLINSFHTPKGAKLAKKQVGVLFKFFGFSFFWAFFQWFFTGGDGCGFSSFPTFGLQAADQRFFFDFSSTYVGVGMICPYMVNISLLLGAIVSWGIMWPLIEAKKGIWFPDHLPGNSLHGIQGYRIFIAIATMLGDGLYHVIYMLAKTLYSLVLQNLNKESSSITPSAGGENTEIVNYDEQRRKEFFLKDQIPTWVAFLGYFGLAAISITTVPLIFHQLKWYHVLVAYLIAPVLAFCNAYGCGLTDWSLASNYGKFAIIIFSAWVGHDGGIIAGLASCGVMMSIVSTASDLMQDFKTGYLTLSSARSMFFSQVAGTAMGCLITPLVFWFFYKAYPTIGESGTTYPAPYGQIYRGIALLGVEGISSLPKNCLTLSISFFVGAIVVNLIRDLLQKYETTYRVYRFIPSPMCMAIPFYIGGYFAIDMCVGSLILFIWEKYNKQRATDFGTAVASGLICGDSLWGIPAAILSLANLAPPICMKFLSAAQNNRVDQFLNS
ncbi:probable metal-nicotianamine transporter YSL7 [Ricinus communis]|uniref:Oligopeptide transporter, putative n=1 Tax=Ricinus communis TaxID=3988 RepID=B9T1I2_RICCO|nr:probable metal-nicotianamine transporter YSL7 [Ricinus communis]EEF30280.1 oligopeptide transporter, putative [Ricinus communis]|eukprot:XP_002532101.1 probable metal-nicotianamine transporter YSL7 [Ricinus communis]